MDDDITKRGEFERHLDRLRSHPSDHVRETARRAKDVLRTQGIEEAKKLIDTLVELRAKPLLQALVDQLGKKGQTAHLSRAVRNQLAHVDDKIETNPQRIVGVGTHIVLWSSRDENRRKVMDFRVA